MVFSEHFGEKRVILVPSMDSTSLAIYKTERLHSSILLDYRAIMRSNTVLLQNDKEICSWFWCDNVGQHMAFTLSSRKLYSDYST